MIKRIAGSNSACGVLDAVEQVSECESSRASILLVERVSTWLVAMAVAMSHELRDKVIHATPAGAKIRKRLQCGDCSGICPYGLAMDFTPRALIAAPRGDHRHGVLESDAVLAHLADRSEPMISVELRRSFPYFTGVSSESFKALAATASERDFPTGEVPFREGDATHYLYILRQGAVDVIYRLHDGLERVVDTVGGGELLGWSAIIAPHRNTATGIARQPGRAVCTDAAELRKLCQQDLTPGCRLLAQVAGVLSGRLQGARFQLAAGM
jgi:CRP/FNR family cyclic AMP-dependent transcriptional regulator